MNGPTLREIVRRQRFVGRHGWIDRSLHDAKKQASGCHSVNWRVQRSRSEAELTLGQALQQMWQQHLGVRVSLAPTELKVWLDLLRNKSFAFTADQWNMSINHPSEMLAMGVTGDPNNDAGWSHARYDAAFAAVENAPDEPARRAAIETCERIIAEEVPFAPVFFTIRTQLVHPAVHGWRGNAAQQIDWTALSLAAPE